MDPEPSLRPYGDAPPERGGPSPHLSDYWQVVLRRLWLVLLVFGVTTASAIFAVSRQRVYYQSRLSLQVNDPAQPARGLVQPGRISGLDIFVDPIESEIQVLSSTQIAIAVVDSLGLRLRSSSGQVRSDLFLEARVRRDAENGQFQLLYDEAGQRAQLQALDGNVVGTAAVGSRLESPPLGFTLQPPPEETRVYGLELVSADMVVGEIMGNLSAAPRQSTNLIDVYFLAPDQIIAPRILNAAAAELRQRGAERAGAPGNEGHQLRRAAPGQRAPSAHALGNADTRVQTVRRLLRPVGPRTTARHPYPESGRATAHLRRTAERPHGCGAGSASAWPPRWPSCRLSPRGCLLEPPQRCAA